MNLSSAQLTSNEMQLLTYGKTFAIISSDKKNTIRATILSDIALGIRNDQRLNTGRVNALIDSAVGLLSDPGPQARADTLTFFKLRKRLRDEDLAIVKADKGETLVVMNKAYYMDRVHAFLLASGAKPIKFSIGTYNLSVRTAIKSSQHSTPIKATKKRLHNMTFSTRSSHTSGSRELH